MSEIDKENLAASFPIVCDAISRSDFVGIDTEFTGLIAHENGKLEYLDDVETRYQKIRQSAAAFAVLQVGLACFSWSSEQGNDTPENGQYSSKVFNFYVFQRFDDSIGFELKKAIRSLESEKHNFMFQSSSLSFLADNDFDFNRCFSKGIPYMNLDQERIVRGSVDLASDNTIQVTAPKDVEFVTTFLYACLLFSF